MDQATKAWFLRVLSGTHQDAMIELESGVTTIGGSDNCDYVFDGLDAEQYSIEIDDAPMLEVHSEFHNVLINGQNLPEPNVQLNERDVISYADIHLAIGHEDTDWAPVTIPAMGEEEQAENIDAGVLEVSREEEQSIDGADNQSDDSEYIGGASVTDRVTQRSPKIRSKKVILLPVIIFAFGLLLAIFTLVDSPDSVAQKIPDLTLVSSPPARVIHNKEQLFKLLTETLPLKNLTANFSPEDLTWTLTGYVKTHQAKKDLQSWVADMNARENLRSPLGEPLIMTESTRVTEQFVSSIQTAISNLGYEGLTVEGTDQPGEMTIKGNLNISEASQEQNWQQTFKRLKGDLPHITQWKNDVTFNRVVSTPNLMVSSVSLGKHPYFVDEGGTRYFVGSLYQGRYRIESITLSRLLLEYQNKVIEYQL